MNNLKKKREYLEMGKTFKDQRKYDRREGKGAQDHRRAAKKPRTRDPEPWDEDEYDDISEYYDPDKIEWDE